MNCLPHIWFWFLGLLCLANIIQCKQASGGSTAVGCTIHDQEGVEDLRLPLGLVGLLVAGLLDLGELRHQHRVGIVRDVVDRHLGGRSARSKAELET